jgi:PAS domain S-box-containing protein
MGIGIWSMHYVGMLAFVLPVQVFYHIPTVIMSLVAAVASSLIALSTVSRSDLGPLRIAVASPIMGAGIAAMHFIGMSAMRLPAQCHWSPALVALSVLLAILISMTALFLLFHLREPRKSNRRKIAGILLMGLAIPVMHYTGMTAVKYSAEPLEAVPPGCIGVTTLGTFAIALISVLVLGSALLFAILDRRFSDKNRRLEFSERKHRQLVESIQAVLWQKDIERDEFTLVNRETESMLGYPAAAWIQDPDFLEHHCHAEDRAILASHCSSAIQSGQTANFEHRLIASDGRIVRLRTSIRAIATPEGSHEMTGVMLDITNTKALEDQLELQRQFFEALMDSIPDYIYFKDRASRFIRINRSMARLFNLSSPEEAIGLTDHDFFGERYAGLAFATEQEIIRTGTSVINLEEQETWPDGRVTWVSTSKVPMYNTDGRVTGVMGISRNITKRKTAELALIERSKQLTDLNLSLKNEMDERKNLEIQLIQAQKLESLGQLAAGVAHEINTPIQYVGDNCKFLSESFDALKTILIEYDGLLTEAASCDHLKPVVMKLERLTKELDIEFLSQEIPSAIAQSIDGLDRVAQIVRAMKEFSHPGSTDQSPVNLNRSIENTLMVCRNEYKYVADVVTEFSPDLPPVYCLAGEINQVVLNLVVNAAHAIADAKQKLGRGLIRVSTRLDGDFAEIRVQDNGTGIPKAIQDRVFDPFFTTKEIGKGSGQGLALARNVAVKKHGGSLTFETIEGQGTTFILRIPTGGKGTCRQQHSVPPPPVETTCLIGE